MDGTRGGSEGGWGGDGGRSLNLFQILALSVFLGAVAGVFAGLAGLSLPMVGLVAWAGTILGALGVTAVLVLAETLATRRAEASLAGPEMLVTIEAWEDDVMREAEEAGRQEKKVSDTDLPIAASDRVASRGPSGARGMG